MGNSSQSRHLSPSKSLNGKDHEEARNDAASAEAIEEIHVDSSNTPSAQVQNDASVPPVELTLPSARASGVFSLLTNRASRCLDQISTDPETGHNTVKVDTKDVNRQKRQTIPATVSQAFQRYSKAFTDPEKITQQRNQAREERDLAFHACGKAIRQRDDALDQRDRARQEMEENVKLYIRASRTHGETVSKIQKITQERDKAIRDRDTADQDCDKLLSELQRLQERNAALEKKNKVYRHDLYAARSCILLYKNEIENLKRKIPSLRIDQPSSTPPDMGSHPAYRLKPEHINTSNPEGGLGLADPTSASASLNDQPKSGDTNSCKGSGKPN